ncbi:Uma2 family endonuclease [soil metagenome]|nr:Uma2 family endonuclease [Gemmatimonadota bacterium]
MSTYARRLDLISVEDYLALDDATEDARLEYAAGHVFALAGASRRHAAIARNLTILLQAALEGRGCDAYATALRLRVAADMYFYPDVMVACGERAGTDRDETAPTLLAEVLSESTEDRDLGLKLAAYGSLPSLLAYLVVAQDTRRVEVHWREREDAPWQHQVVRGAGIVHLAALGGVDLPLDRIYARTDI